MKKLYKFEWDLRKNDYYQTLAYLIETKPILLLADSQLLFLKNKKQQYYLESIVSGISNKSPACAYIGASNNDEPAYFELFESAMHNIGFFDCKMITSSFNKDEREFLNKADLILLAGGDTELGLQVFREKGIEEILQKKYLEGTTFIGVSAGAVQLGWQSCIKLDESKYKFTDGLKLVPFIVLVHLDKKNLKEAEAVLINSTTIKRCYEIPFGGGLIFYPDYTAEAVRKPINEYILKDGNLVHTLIFPENE